MINAGILNFVMIKPVKAPSTTPITSATAIAAHTEPVATSTMQAIQPINAISEPYAMLMWPRMMMNVAPKLSTVVQAIASRMLLRLYVLRKPGTKSDAAMKITTKISAIPYLP